MIICILAYGWADLMLFKHSRGEWRGCWRHVKLIKAHGSKSSLCLVNTCCQRWWHWWRSGIQGWVRETWSVLCDYACLAVITTEFHWETIVRSLFCPSTSLLIYDVMFHNSPIGNLLFLVLFPLFILYSGSPKAGHLELKTILQSFLMTIQEWSFWNKMNMNKEEFFWLAALW